MSALHGFEQTRQRRIGELDAVLHEYTHAASGARLCWLEREDENKSFCAAFRTLPFDDSGVFHILEHSVLCGSKHFPVKEPFVELMKGSLQQRRSPLQHFIRIDILAGNRPVCKNPARRKKKFPLRQRSADFSALFRYGIDTAYPMRAHFISQAGGSGRRQIPQPHLPPVRA